MIEIHCEYCNAETPQPIEIPVKGEIKFFCGKMCYESWKLLMEKVQTNGKHAVS